MGTLGDSCIVLSCLVLWKLKVVLGDESGVVLLTLWPPASRFHGAMLAATEKATAECFPMAKLSQFEVRVCGRTQGASTVKLEGAEGSTVVMSGVSMFDISPSPGSYVSDFIQLTEFKAGLVGSFGILGLLARWTGL